MDIDIEPSALRFFFFVIENIGEIQIVDFEDAVSLFEEHVDSYIEETVYEADDDEDREVYEYDSNFSLDVLKNDIEDGFIGLERIFLRLSEIGVQAIVLVPESPIPGANLSKQFIDDDELLCDYCDGKEVVTVVVPIGDFYMCGQISGNEIQT